MVEKKFNIYDTGAAARIGEYLAGEREAQKKEAELKRVSSRPGFSLYDLGDVAKITRIIGEERNTRRGT
jgi:hypothetical protein